MLMFFLLPANWNNLFAWSAAGFRDLDE